MDELRLYLTAMIEEYKSLRDESKQASINMFSALRWGAAVLGVVIGAGFSLWNKQHAVVLLIFYVVLPVLSAASMFLWLGEAARFKRVGDYICLLEQKTSLLLHDVIAKSVLKDNWPPLQKQMETNLQMSHSSLNLSDPLIWEQWLRDMRKSVLEGHLSLIYLIRLSFFPGVMLFSLLTALYYTLTHPRLVPPFLKSFETYVPDAKEGVLYLFILWFIVFIFSMTISGIIAWRLRAKTMPTIRKQPETNE